MGENTYRVCKLVLLCVLTAFTGIAVYRGAAALDTFVETQNRIAAKAAENGRFVQYDHVKQGGVTYSPPTIEPVAVDTRTGELVYRKEH